MVNFKDQPLVQLRTDAEEMPAQNPDMAMTELDPESPCRKIDLATPDVTPSPPNNQEGLEDYEAYVSGLNVHSYVMLGGIVVWDI